MLAGHDTSFLRWLYNRLRYKYIENESILEHLKYIIDHLSINVKDISIDDKKLDAILRKYYLDFDDDKILDNGFTDDERHRLRHTVKNLVFEIINN
jgi:hypothetical protein